jgi:hypothetical protein
LTTRPARNILRAPKKILAMNKFSSGGFANFCAAPASPQEISRLFPQKMNLSPLPAGKCRCGKTVYAV